MLVATAAAEVPEAVRQRVLGWTAGAILSAPCQLHRSGVAAGRGSRAGLTGWYSGCKNEPSKANIAKTASEARSPASESLNYQLRKIIKTWPDGSSKAPNSKAGTPPTVPSARPSSRLDP
jgi:hypothetical protein